MPQSHRQDRAYQPPRGRSRGSPLRFVPAAGDRRDRAFDLQPRQCGHLPRREEGPVLRKAARRSAMILSGSGTCCTCGRQDVLPGGLAGVGLGSAAWGT